MLELRLHHITQPMRSGFVHSRASRNTAEAIICTIHHENMLGIGECVPRHYVTGEKVESVIDAIMDCDIESITSSIHTSTLDAAASCLPAAVNGPVSATCAPSMNPNRLCLANCIKRVALIMPPCIVGGQIILKRWYFIFMANKVTPAGY